MGNSVVHRFCLIISLMICGWLAGTARADSFKLTTGETLIGEVLAATANDAGVQIKAGEGDYKKVPWASFSQEDLKKFAQNKKMEPFVEPFIEITQEEKIKKTEVNIKQPPRLERPPAQSLIGSLFSSGLGLFIALLLYAANFYAAYEVALYRAQPPGLVCGVSAVLPLAGPVLFLALPTRVAPRAPAWESEPAGETAEALNPMQDTSAAHPASLKLAETQTANAVPALPPSTTFQRGQFTFNRRFFETKFAGFFGIVRRDAERDMVLLVKSARGQFLAERITRIAANDVHLQVQKGHASEEVMVPFVEIQEIQLKHKDA